MILSVVRYTSVPDTDERITIMVPTTSPTTVVSRRGFLRGASLGIGGAALGGLLTACSTTSSAAAPSGQHDMTAMPAGQNGGMTADEMDAMHEAGIKAFVSGVKTEGVGNQPLQPRIENGVKIFELTCKKISFEVAPGQKVEALSYNGQVPGPELRVTE